MINCAVELDLSWTKDYVLREANKNMTGVNLMIPSNKLYVPMVTLSIKNNTRFLENLKQELNNVLG